MPSYNENRFLSSLSLASRDILIAECVQTDLPFKESLYEANATPAYAYFITSGVVSIATTMADGAVVEVGLIGHEGIVGSLHLLGPAKIATRCFAQRHTSALRIPFGFLAKVFRANEEIRDRLLEFTQEQSVILGQLAACHRLHEVGERLARWLLMAQDLTHSSIIEFTQESLAEMLGARRTTVTVAAGKLQRNGLIEYSRGKVRILDRKRLASVACDCYPITCLLNQSLYSHAATDLTVSCEAISDLEKIIVPRPGGYPYGAFGADQCAPGMHDGGPAPVQPNLAGSANPTGRG